LTLVTKKIFEKHLSPIKQPPKTLP